MAALASMRIASLFAVATVCSSALLVLDGPATTSQARTVRDGSMLPRRAASASTSTIALTKIASQHVRRGYSETVRVGQVVPVSGSVSRLPRQARVQLQSRTTGAWQTVLSSPLRDADFTLHWHVRTRAYQLRAVLLSEGHRVAASATASVLVGPAIVRCRPAAAPTMLPAGDGWIAGGVYLMGGAAPGLDQCQSSASTITATSTSGSVVLTKKLAGGDGYALVLPAGGYELRDGVCRGQATVTAGQRTVADTDCDYP